MSEYSASVYGPEKVASPRGGIIAGLMSRTGWALLFGALLMAGLVVAGTWSFGLWEPWESRTALVAGDLAGGRPADAGGSVGNAVIARSQQRPPLPYHAAAVSARLLGQSEFAFRLPSMLLGLMLLAGVWVAGRKTMGNRAANLAGLIMITSPLYLLLSRQAFPESMAVSGQGMLLLGALLSAHEHRRTQGAGSLPEGGVWAWCAWMLLGALVVLGAGGAWPLLVSSSIIWLWIWLGRQQDNRVLIASAAVLSALALLLGLLGALGSDGSLWVRLGFTYHLHDRFLQEPRTVETFEFFIRQLGFGLFPWVVFIRFAFGRSLWKEDEGGHGRDGDPPRAGLLDGQDRLIMKLVLIWFVGGVLLSAIGLAATRYHTFTALPAVALGLGGYLASHDRLSPLAARFGALVIGVMALLLIRDLHMEPQVLVESVAFDGALTRPPGFGLPLVFSISGGIWIAGAVLLLFSRGRPSNPVSFRFRPLKAAAHGWHLLTSPVLALVLLVSGGLGIGLSIAHGYVPSFSLHKSEKAILDVYRTASQGAQPLLGHMLDLSEEAWYGRGIQEIDSSHQLLPHLRGEDRVFLLLPRTQLAPVNRLFYEQTGRHLRVLDDRSSRYLLASNVLGDGEEDLNPISQNVFKELPAEANISVGADLDGRIELLAVGLPEHPVRAGGSFHIDIYYRAKTRVTQNWRVFLHIERGSHRIPTALTDHLPLDGAYPTNFWTPGDIVRNRVSVRVPRLTPSGEYSVYSGLFIGNRRIRVVQAPEHDDSNRVLLGRIAIR